MCDEFKTKDVIELDKQCAAQVAALVAVEPPGRTGHGQRERICKATSISSMHTRWSFCPYVLYAPALSLVFPGELGSKLRLSLTRPYYAYAFHRFMRRPVAVPFMLLA